YPSTLPFIQFSRGQGNDCSYQLSILDVFSLSEFHRNAQSGLSPECLNSIYFAYRILSKALQALNIFRSPAFFPSLCCCFLWRSTFIGSEAGSIRIHYQSWRHLQPAVSVPELRLFLGQSLETSGYQPGMFPPTELIRDECG